MSFNFIIKFYFIFEIAFSISEVYSQDCHDLLRRASHLQTISAGLGISQLGSIVDEIAEIFHSSDPKVMIHSMGYAGKVNQRYIPDLMQVTEIQQQTVQCLKPLCDRLSVASDSDIEKLSKTELSVVRKYLDLAGKASNETRRLRDEARISAIEWRAEALRRIEGFVRFFSEEYPEDLFFGASRSVSANIQSLKGDTMGISAQDLQKVSKLGDDIIKKIATLLESRNQILKNLRSLVSSLNRDQILERATWLSTLNLRLDEIFKGLLQEYKEIIPLLRTVSQMVEISLSAQYEAAEGDFEKRSLIVGYLNQIEMIRNALNHSDRPPPNLDLK